jgi:hypothetical protein
VPAFRKLYCPLDKAAGHYEGINQTNKLLSLFNSFLPFFNLPEKLAGPPFGLSIILLCRKHS